MLEAREAAAFLQGYVAAKRTRTPKWLIPHLKTVAQIFSGGAFNPLCVYEMQDAAKRLWQEAINAGIDKAVKHGS